MGMFVYTESIQNRVLYLEADIYKENEMDGDKTDIVPITVALSLGQIC